ncbi:MAG: right-handed parallel beta-helix repeat-containing protein, partial [Phycisphaerae bacterium]|nr:right-handed parallel beta-helix repeat-containing protein [Phycisphaerae bacterium]
MKSCGMVFSRRGGWSCIAIAFVLLIGQACVAEQYIPPIGIPAPPFGINESHTMYAGQWYTAGGFTYRDAGNGPYTHYVDNTHPSATDVGNPYGTAATPRASLPLGTLPAGSVVEIHGGPYFFSSNVDIVSQGTAEDPVFVRAVDPENKVLLRASGSSIRLRCFGSYVIYENLELSYGLRFQSYEYSHHTAIRYCEVSGPEGVYLGSNAGVHADEWATYMVIFRNHIHHNVRLSDGNPVDVHGVAAGSGSHHVWVLENEIHHNSGDAFQASDHSNPVVHHFYVGGNVMHDDRENGVDLKHIEDVVVSQNKIYSYLPSTYLGDAVVIGANGFEPGVEGPTRAWFLFNEIWNCKNGIRVEGARDCYIVGNTIREASGNAIQLDIDPDSLNVNIVSNTLVGIGSKGIAYGWKEPGASGFSFANNIFRNIGSYHVDVPAFVASTGELRNNLFWDSGASISIRWGSSTYTGLDPAGVNALPDSSGNVIGDPLLVDIPGADFHIQAGSAAANAGIVSAVYQDFFDLYAVDIKLDYDGLPRPQEGLWDIGAFELPAGLGVAGRHVFYNNSAWDGNDPAANAADDAAIATDKTALLPNQVATFANYTSYLRGINGVMVDIDGLAGTPTASDFEFKVGNDNNPGAWPTGPAPTSVAVRAGAGAGGSDRITIIWADNAIEKQWLQVTVLATANTGLATNDVFYFGNAIGETG